MDLKEMRRGWYKSPVRHPKGTLICTPTNTTPGTIICAEYCEDKFLVLHIGEVVYARQYGYGNVILELRLAHYTGQMGCLQRPASQIAACVGWQDFDRQYFHIHPEDNLLKVMAKALPFHLKHGRI